MQVAPAADSAGLVAGSDSSPFAGDSGSPVIGFSSTLSKLVLVGILSGGASQNAIG
jgi:hypothetical protein